MTETRAIEITDPSGTAEARRQASMVARRRGFDDEAAGRVAIVVTEAGSNLVKHARGGTLLLTAGGRGATAYLQMVAIDRGPGFDLATCKRDGHSTSGSPGTGLGAIDRLSAVFDVYSARGKGSVVFAEVRPRHAARPPADPLLVAGMSVAKAGEDECGDAWVTAARADGAVVLLTDGLGHGPAAADASRQAVRAFERAVDQPPAAVLDRVHAALRPTRGATVAVAAVDVRARRVRYAGIGNIMGSVTMGEATRHMVSHNGTAGHEVAKIQEFEYPWSENALLIMATDGLTSRWNLDGYPGAARCHPAVVAGLLLRDFSRQRDDATVVVGRQTRVEEPAAGLEWEKAAGHGVS